MRKMSRKSLERAADTATAPARAIVRLARLVRLAIANYVEHRSASIAAAIAFHALLSFAPLILVVCSALGFWLKSVPEAYDKVRQLLEAMLPVRPPVAVERELETIVRSRGIAGGVGLVALVWLSSNVFHLVNEAVTVASGEKRRYIRSRLMAMLMTLIVAFFLFVGFGFASLVAFVRDALLARGFLPAQSLSAYWYLVDALVTVLVSGLTFTTIYHLLPPKRVRIRASLCGGFGTAIVWEFSRRVFAWYFSHISTYQTIYGSLANMVILLVWAYYSAMLLLLGAELTFAFENERLKLEQEQQTAQAAESNAAPPAER